jgi:hypothetical protein
MIDFDWSVTKMLKDPATGEVKRIFLDVTASRDDGAVVTESISFPTEPSTADNFIKYEELSLEDVMSWFKDKKSIEDYLTIKIDEYRLESVDKDSLPWV